MSKWKSGKVSHNLTNSRRNILSTLVNTLKRDFPEAYMDGKRAVIPWSGPDRFIIYFSNEVKDAIRLAFVVDLDIKESARRRHFQETLSLYVDDIQTALGAKVLSAHKVSGIRNKSPETIVNEGYKEWAKISYHSRMGLYKIVRLEYDDWDATDTIVEKITPLTYEFVEGVSSILQRIKLPPI